MDIGKISSAGFQTIAPGVVKVTMSKLVFEDPTGSVDANASSSTLSFAEAGYYLFVWDVTVVGTGDQKLSLAGDGVGEADSGLEYVFFTGEATGISHGKAVVLKCTAGAVIGLQAINSGAGSVSYFCTLAAAKLADIL